MQLKSAPRAVVGFIALLTNLTASAQSPALADLKKLAADVTKPGFVLEGDEIQRAEKKLADWKLAPDKLPAEAQADLAVVECTIALAHGNAAGAREKFLLADKAAPQAPATLEVGYLTACATGDGQLAERVLRTANTTAPADRKELISQRRRWANGFGKKAPEVTIRPQAGSEVEVLRRGDKVLLIDFWNSQFAAPAATMALKALQERFKTDRNFELVGVNAESAAHTAKAQEFAKSAGMIWSTRYEEELGKAPLTNLAFKAGNPPWTVIVDTFGFVRAIGAANDAGFHYALRAAMSEARGEFEPLFKGGAPGSDSKGAAQASQAKKKDAVQNGDLPSNEEAASKLRQARAFWKGGKRTDAKKLAHEVIDQYPGTQEAKEAAEFLVDWEQQP